jgi:uncharacterized protein (DUF983 family)
MDAMKKDKEADELDSVDLVASGYEWECPCGKLNKEIEITEQVTCSECGQRYNTNPAEHAYE